MADMEIEAATQDSFQMLGTFSSANDTAIVKRREGTTFPGVDLETLRFP